MLGSDKRLALCLVFIGTPIPAMQDRESILPENLQCKLHLPRGGRCTGDRTGRSRYTSRCEDNQVRSVEIGTVEKIEKFCPELQCHALANLSVFEGGKIPRPQ